MKQSIINNIAYIKLLEGFKEWLEILGYASVSVDSHPATLREFLNYMEQHQLNDIQQVDNQVVYNYFDYLKNRKNIRTNLPLANGFLNKQLQTIRLFSDYLRDAHKHSFSTDLLGFKNDTPKALILQQREIELLYKAVSNTAYGQRDCINFV
jgi:site-specific recombinase XerD